MHWDIRLGAQSRVLSFFVENMLCILGFWVGLAFYSWIMFIFYGLVFGVGFGTHAAIIQ